MRKFYLQSCRVFLVLILCFDVNLAGKKGSYSVPLLRTKRDLKDSRGNPTENLKGRPGQGYYIATDLGTPAQRVSDAYFSKYPCVYHCLLSPTLILLGLMQLLCGLSFPLRRFYFRYRFHYAFV